MTDTANGELPQLRRDSGIWFARPDLPAKHEGIAATRVKRPPSWTITLPGLADLP